MGIQVRVFLSSISGPLKFTGSRPDRWDDLPDAAKAQPGLYSNLMSFSAGPRVSNLPHHCHVRVSPCIRSPALVCDSRLLKSRSSSTCLSPISPSTILGLRSSRRTCESPFCSLTHRAVSHPLSPAIKRIHASIHQGQVRGRVPVTFACCSLRQMIYTFHAISPSSLENGFCGVFVLICCSVAY